MSAPRRLSRATLALASAETRRPAYDTATTQTGILHFGPGAFHRAHQASFFDRGLAENPNLGICAVSMHSRDVIGALRPQDGLFTLVEQKSKPVARIIGSLTQVLHAGDDAAAVMNQFSNPGLRMVTATVTEKGYCLASDGSLDLGHPDIISDLSGDKIPASLIGLLARGLNLRRAAGLPGLTLISCDNLPANGEKLGRAVLDFCIHHGQADLADWIRDGSRFPDTMVDSITPATDEALRKLATQMTGLEDAWPIQRETFAEWVVSDAAGPDAATLAACGARIVTDVAGFEFAKLRLLNGAHSALAYLGLALDVRTVAEAMRHSSLAQYVEGLMREDIAPRLPATPGLDLQVYISSILDRFRNPAIHHNLAQIAWDGSMKLPIRLLSTFTEAVAAGASVARFSSAIAAWMSFILTKSRTGEPLTDPMADQLLAIAEKHGSNLEVLVVRLMETEIFPSSLRANADVRREITSRLEAISDGRFEAVLTPLN